MLTAIDDNEFCLTENGAIGYKTSGVELVDINVSLSSMRNLNESTIIKKYIRAFNEDKILAVKWLFYARDCRNGAGERRFFRICLDYLSKHHPEITKAILKFIPEYGRWDDVLGLLYGDLADDVFNLIRKQLIADKKNMKKKRSISLCAKWMPSIKTSSEKTKEMARILIKKFNCNEKEYRQLLSKLRSYLKVIEVSMSAKKWEEINYSAVPSRANLIYKQAFLKNDKERREEYLENLKKGKTKIHSRVLFPHDIINKYNRRYCVDDTYEQLWKALPDYVNGNSNTICVSDGSGSMCKSLPDSYATCLDVANSLAIYFSERSSGRYKDKFITFCSRPSLVDLSQADSLLDKIHIMRRYDYCDNTNIEAVFNLILKDAVDHHLPQSELPANILILSDCEFDSMVEISGRQRPDATFFSNIKTKFNDNGYLLPRLVFWNICGRTETIPMKKNDLGVALVSGFSTAIIKMVLSNKLDPFECLLEQINSERYQPIEDALKKIIK